MKGGLLTMSRKEIKRVTVLQQVMDKRIKQKEAAKQLKLSTRQIKRLIKNFRKEGEAGIISKHRGRPGNRGNTEDFKEKVKELIQRHYSDFGPMLAAEKLHEREGIKINRETLRQWMISWDFWKAHRQKKAQIHQQRERRACLGELVQIDGSHHDWFEGRAPKCCLLVFVDDATSQLLYLHFEIGETTAGYFRAARAYIDQYGLPLSFYSDKDSVFRVNQGEEINREETQFGRVCKALEIELICANSPQAKGRVERCNKTLQDRLIKEMRLRGINDMASANAFLPEFIKDYNGRFAVQSRSEINVHRPLNLTKQELDLLFSFQHERTLSKNLELSYNNVIYQVKTATTGYRLRHAKVMVCENLEGNIALVYQGKMLTYNCYKKAARAVPVIGAKELLPTIDNLVKKAQTKVYKPATDHPWRQGTLRKEMVEKLKNHQPLESRI
jgi:transposase